MPKTNTTTAAASDDRLMLETFERLALAAGREVMRVFHAGCAVDRKSDASPVTEADRESEKIILAGLRAAFPDIPCVAEEEASAGIAPPDLDAAFFLIDPLDGTKEFVNRRTDFTVNIALVRDGVPEIGVVFAPCTGRFFSGLPGRAESLEINGDYQIVGRRPQLSAGEPLAVQGCATIVHRSQSLVEQASFFRARSRVRVAPLLEKIADGGEHG